MASIKDLKKRIGSTKNTQQTTKAMKMVSAAKLRRAQETITHQRPYARRIGGLIRLVSSLSDEAQKNPLIRREREEGAGKKKVLLVLVTSDRGLCGGFNSNVMKAAIRWIAENQATVDVTLSFVGRKAYDFFKNKKYTIGKNYTEAAGKVTFAKAKGLTDGLIELYLSGAFDEVKFVYNEFKNAVTQKVLVEGFLPLEDASVNTDAIPESEGGLFIVRPDLPTLMESLLQKHFATQVFRVLLDSQASEHGARMSAMENATKNAGEMIRKLTLQYNKQRQAGITKELLEIIAGSESQKQ